MRFPGPRQPIDRPCEPWTPEHNESKSALCDMRSWRHRDSVAAICPSPVPKACSSFFQGDAVFVAKVLSRPYADTDESLRFEVRVSRVLRGEVKPTADVYTGNDSGRLNWDVGREYVVFASRREGRLAVLARITPSAVRHRPLLGA